MSNTKWEMRIAIGKAYTYKDRSISKLAVILMIKRYSQERCQIRLGIQPQQLDRPQLQHQIPNSMAMLTQYTVKLLSGEDSKEIWAMREMAAS